jgi:TolB protein
MARGTTARGARDRRGCGRARTVLPAARRSPTLGSSLAAALAAAASAAVLVGAARPAAGAEADALRQVTHGPGINAMPAWAPDARRIVFHSRRKTEESKGKLPTRKIWVMNPDGTEARAVSEGAGDEYHATWSPRGDRILFVSEANGNRDVWVMGAGGDNPVPLTDDPGVEDHPAWSPDGARVVYAAFPKDGGNFDLWIMNSDGSGRHRLTSSAANEIFPAWHPGGDVIAYVTDVGGHFDIHGVRPADQTTFAIVASPDHDVRPAWSPDGTKIAFARWPARGRSEDTSLWLANFDGTVPIQLDVPIGATHPAWSPDGRLLAFQRRTSEGWDVWTYAPPPALVRAGRLHLAQQFRGGTSDLVTLRTGERYSGIVRTARYQVRTPYGALDLSRDVVASVSFGAERGLARLILVNGDTVSGFLLDDTIRMATDGSERSFGIEVLESVGLRLQPGEPPTAGLRVTMRNGDALTAALAGGPLRVRVGAQTVDVAPATIAHATVSDDGTKLRAELRSGDTVSGDLASGPLELRLAVGGALTVRPGLVSMLTGAERPPGPAAEAPR